MSLIIFSKALAAKDRKVHIKKWPIQVIGFSRRSMIPISNEDHYNSIVLMDVCCLA